MEVPVVSPRPRSPGHGEHHVHFSASGEDSDVLPPAHQVDVVAADDKIGIHAGFLKAMHQYRVTCRVPLVCHDWEAAEMPALHWRVREMRPEGAATALTLQVVATKEKLLREKLVLRSPDGDRAVTLELNARVLGKNTGTPFLREGVHLEGVIKEDEGSEASDWHGFDWSAAALDPPSPALAAARSSRQRAAVTASDSHKPDQTPCSPTGCLQGQLLQVTRSAWMQLPLFRRDSVGRLGASLEPRPETGVEQWRYASTVTVMGCERFDTTLTECFTQLRDWERYQSISQRRVFPTGLPNGGANTDFMLSEQTAIYVASFSSLVQTPDAFSRLFSQRGQNRALIFRIIRVIRGVIF